MRLENIWLDFTKRVLGGGRVEVSFYNQDLIKIDMLDRTTS